MSTVKSEDSNYIRCVIINIYTVILIVNNQLWSELLAAMLSAKPFSREDD
jgi:hypothetical protein